MKLLAFHTVSAELSGYEKFGAISIRLFGILLWKSKRNRMLSQSSSATGLYTGLTASPYFSIILYVAVALAAPHENQAAILKPAPRPSSNRYP